MPDPERFDDKHTITLGGGRARGMGRELRQGEIVGGSYKLKSLIGRGGMGYVFCAEHVIIQRDYALKLLAPNMLDAASKKRFEQEGRAIANLDHPNIVKVYNMGLDKGDCPYYVMDLLDGVALSDRIEAERQGLPVDAVLDIFDQIASGLAYAHSKGIIHRDIKPSNIILLKGDRGKPLVKIVDFGIAKMIDKASFTGQAQTAAGEIFGTPFYMSPEQGMGGEIDARSDIYSLGCTFYQAFCGRPPYAGNTAFETLMMHQSAPIASICEARPDAGLPEAIDIMLGRMMAKNPANRYRTMSQVMHDIERLQQGKPIGRGLSSDGSGAGSSSEWNSLDGDHGEHLGDDQVKTGFPVKLMKGARVGHWTVFAIILASMLFVAALGLMRLGKQNNDLSTLPAESALPAAGMATATGLSPSVVMPTGVSPTATGVMPSGLMQAPVMPSAKGNFERPPVPDDDKVEDKLAKAVLISTKIVEDAREVYRQFGNVRSRVIDVNGVPTREFQFPDVTIGLIKTKGDRGQQARRRVLIKEGVPFEFVVSAIDCPAFYVPEVFARAKEVGINFLLLEGLGETAQERYLPGQLRDKGYSAKILKYASSWEHLKAVKLTSIEINDDLLKALDKCTQVETVEFHKCLWTATLSKNWTCLNRADEIVFDRISNSNAALGCLGKASRLRKLKLEGLIMTGDNMDALRACRRLTRLEFNRLQQITDGLYRAVTRLDDVRMLRLTHMNPTRGQIEILQAGPHVRAVLIDVSGMFAEDRKKLEPLPAKVKLLNEEGD